MAKIGIVQQMSERLQSQTSMSNLGVSIHTLTQWLQAVVQMKRLNEVHAYQLNQLIHGMAIILFLLQRISGGEDVASVHTNAEPVGLLHLRKYLGQMLELPTQRGPLSGGGFQQTARLAAGLAVNFV